MNLQISGGRTLAGSLAVSGSKNSAWAILPAVLLTERSITLQNVPNISDVQKIMQLYANLKIKHNYDASKEKLEIQASRIDATDFKDMGAAKMRAVFLFFVPLVIRLGRLEVSADIAGCTLGVRQVDTFFENLETFGIYVKEEHNKYYLDASKLHAATVWQDEASVTSTEAAVMAAVLAPGKSIIYNAACEPHVQDLCHFLNKLGAHIRGVGSNKLTIEGVKKLEGGKHRLMDDYLGVGTYLSLSALTGAQIKIKHHLDPFLLTNMFEIYSRFGVHTKTIKTKRVGQFETSIVKMDSKVFEPRAGGYYHLKIAPWPGFPVDLLPMLIPVAAHGNAPAMLHNWMYDGGLNWVSELNKFGANIIQADPHRVITYPVTTKKLTPAVVDSPYIIRAGMALIIMALSIKGTSMVMNVEAVERGYPNFFNRIRKLGASLKVIT